MGNERKTILDLYTSGEDSGEAVLAEKEETALRIFGQYNNPAITLDTQLLVKRIRSSLLQNSCLEFIQFTCPRIDAVKLFSSRPEEYISTDPKGNNFESTSGRLAKLIRSLNSQGIPSLVNVILVDTDEKDYVFPVLGTPTNINDENAYQRKVVYFDRLSKNIKNKYTNWLTGEVFLWSQIRDDVSMPCPPPDSPSLDREITRLTELFSPGNYYGGFYTPTPKELEDIAKLKFSAYANQGYQVSRYFPNAILLQNEFPLTLRTYMLNLLNDPLTEIPAIYPYGRSESPY